MEQNGEYQSLLALIHKLRQQVNQLEAIKRHQDTSALRREIEEHFERCIHALTVRRDTLISELNVLAAHHDEEISNMQAKLNEDIANCSDILHAGSLIYKSNKSGAEGVWKAEKDKLLTQREANAHALDAQLELSPEILKLIGSHGAVYSPTRDPIASTTTSVALPPITTSQRSASTPTQHVPIPNSSVSRIPPSNTSTLTTPAKDIAPITVPASPKQIIPSFARASIFHKTVSTFVTGDTLKTSERINGICFNPNDSCLYITCGDNSIRKLTLQGQSSKFASVESPGRIVVNYAENSLLVTSYWAGVITKIDSKGNTSAFAKVDKPAGIAMHDGILYASSECNYEIFTVTSRRGYVDGDSDTAKFKVPLGLCFDASSQSLLVCDKNNNRIRRVSPTGVVSTVCEVERPNHIAITASGTVLVTSRDDRIYRVYKRGEGYYAVVIAGGGGDGKAGNKDGDAESSRFSYPLGITVHEPSHSCFVVDYDNRSIRRITFED